MLNVDSIYQEYADLVYKYLYAMCHDEQISSEICLRVVFSEEDFFAVDFDDEVRTIKIRDLRDGNIDSLK